MKNAIKLALSAAALIIANSASATAILDTYNPAPIVIDSKTPFTHEFDIRSGKNLFEPNFDKLVDAYLSYTLKDTGNDKDGVEAYTVKISGSDLAWQTGSDVPNGVNSPFSFELKGSGFDALNTTGMLTMSITATSGSFQFVSASLSGNYTEGVVAPGSKDVPEPFSVALVGIGLAGLAAARRKQS